MRQIKSEAIRCSQSPLQRAFGYADSALKFATSAKGIYDTGRSILAGAQAAAPYVRAAATAVSLL